MEELSTNSTAAAIEIGAYSPLDVTQAGKVTIWSSVIITEALYVAATVYGIFNVYNYLYIQGRHRQSKILAVFYALSILTCLVRIASNSYIVAIIAL